MTFPWFQSQSSWVWATDGRWRSSSRWPSPWGSCCSPDWPTSSRTGAGCSWPSPCPSSCSSSATGTMSPWGPIFPTARAALPQAPGFQPPTPSAVLHHGAALISGGSHSQPLYLQSFFKFTSPRERPEMLNVRQKST